MAKLPDKFEDWTPPWKDDEFDADAAARRIYNTEVKLEQAKARNATLVAEKQELQDKYDDLEHSTSDKPKDTDAQTKRIGELEKELRQLQRDGRSEDKNLIERLEIAIDHGLTARDARRLVGESREELEEDAKDLSQRFGKTSDDNSEDDGEQGQGQPDPRFAPVPTGAKNGGKGNGPAILSPAELLKAAELGGGARALSPQR